MTKQMPISLDRVFVPAGTPSFQTLIDDLSAQGTLFPTRQRDMISGLSRVAKALGLPPSDVPCDGRWLQPRLAKVSPALLGIKPKTWQNAVSNARAAMASHGIVERRQRRAGDLSTAWRALWAALLRAESPSLPSALCRFVHFVNRLGVQPHQVTETHALAYRDAVATNEISKDPETSYRAAVNGWNLAMRRVPGWPQVSLSLPSRQKIIRLPAEAFPSSFVTDVDTLIARLGTSDPLSEDGRNRTLRPDTLIHYRRQIMRFASELVYSGLAPEDITSVACLLEPPVAERGLRHMLSQNDNQTSRTISETAALLRNLAGILDKPEEVRKALIKLAGKVALRPQKGMTTKNRTRLRVLQEPRHQLRLLQLPEKIYARHTGKQKPHYAALAREDALAIAILLVCPLRAKSLANLELDRHVQRPGDGHVYLVLEDADTKTARPIEFELPPDVVKMLDSHLASRVPYMCPAGTPFLFPQRSGKRAIDASCLATRISRRVMKETGLAVNAHLFRHFAVMTWLDANPGGYEVARRLLGHSELSHTINLYSGMEMKSATRAFSDLVGELKQGRR